MTIVNDDKCTVSVGIQELGYGQLKPRALERPLFVPHSCTQLFDSG